MLREWSGALCDPAVFPYNSDFRPLKEDFSLPLFRYLWSYRTNLANSKMFGGKTKVQSGLQWYEFGRLTHDKLRTSLFVAFAFVATHNHFVLDRGGKVFNRSAPVIKLPADATEDDHLAILGLLNSSTACFWMKQVMNCKGLGGQGGGIKPEHWSRQYEYAGTQMERYPIPATYRSLIPIAKEIDALARSAVVFLPDGVIQSGVLDLANRLIAAKQEFEASRRKMVALQEELDWKVYSLYGLCQDTTGVIECGRLLHPEDRPVEKLLNKRLAQGEKSIFYEVHAYRGTGTRNGAPDKHTEAVVQQRLAIIEKNAELRLLEQLDFKRRWQTEPWEKQEQQALRNWLLEWLEKKSHATTPQLTTAAHLADKASGNADFMQVAALYRGRPDFDVSALVTELVESESVPFLPVLRYKPSGLRKRIVWERTWDLQRQADDPEIPVPPKYTSADFQKTDYWRLRGKLDVPKERWISYPHCHTESDPSLVVCWAGWDHLQQATALVAYYDARKREGWDAKRQMPLLAGLDQLLPWIHQWHLEIDRETGNTAGQDYQGVLEEDTHELGLTIEEIRRWTPPARTTRRRTRK
jgi:hypothetical protein